MNAPRLPLPLAMQAALQEPQRRAAPEAASAINGAELLLAGHDDDRVAIECEGERIRYGELRDRVARAAGAWRAQGLAPGGRVAVKLPDGIDWAVAWLGAVWAGGVAVGVNPRIPADEWAAILDEAGFAIVVCDSPDGTPPRWLSGLTLRTQACEAWAAAAPVPPLRLDAEQPALWVHSSGSSGRAKAVVHAQRALAHIAEVSAQRLGLVAQDRLFASSKLFFTYPLVNSLLAGLRIGATVLLDPQWPSAESLAQSLATLKPTVLFSVPSLYRNLLQAGLARQAAEAGVRLCVSAGEALPQRLREAWTASSGLPLFDGYGASETLVLVLASAPGDDALRPSPGVTVEPVDVAAAEQGAPTRLRLRSPTVALGYHDRPAAQAASFVGGAFCPADLFVRHGAGWRFAGRDDSLVKIRGRWVDLVELEQRLGAGVPGLHELAAVHAPDGDGVDALALFYACEEGAPAEATRAVGAALAARIAELPQHQRPSRLEAVAALPRTATGKLARGRLRARLHGNPR